MSRGLLLIDHGSRNQAANSSTEKLAVRLQKRLQLPVFGCHMEGADPGVSDGFIRLQEQGVERIIVLPLFITRGMHLEEDIPAMCRAAAETVDVSWELLPPLAEDAGFVDYLMARVKANLSTA